MSVPAGIGRQRPNRAAVRRRNALQAAEQRAGTTHRQPALDRIHLGIGKVAGTAELAGAELAAAAGARLMRVRHCRALGGLRLGALDSWGCGELSGKLGRVLARP